jgi:hypothetical protein
MSLRMRICPTGLSPSHRYYRATIRLVRCVLIREGTPWAATHAPRRTCLSFATRRPRSGTSGNGCIMAIASRFPMRSASPGSPEVMRICVRGSRSRAEPPRWRNACRRPGASFTPATFAVPSSSATSWARSAQRPPIRRRQSMLRHCRPALRAHCRCSRQRYGAASRRSASCRENPTHTTCWLWCWAVTASGFRY